MGKAERLPAPWAVIEHQESYEVRDATGRSLVFVYFEDEPARRMTLHRLTKAAASLLASRMAKIPNEPLVDDEPLGPQAPWTSREAGESYTVTDATGQGLAHIYFEDEPLRRRASGRISREMARRLASRIAKIGNGSCGKGAS